MNLFQSGDFTLSSGRNSFWKIDCDALTPEDWDTLARITAAIVPPFIGAVEVPRGGLPFAAALKKYAIADGESELVLLVDDVLTTGKSMEEMRERLALDCYTGVVVFARGECPEWITPLFRMG